MRIGNLLGFVVGAPLVAFCCLLAGAEPAGAMRPKIMQNMADNGINSRKLDPIVIVSAALLFNFWLALYVLRIYEPLCQTLEASRVSKSTV